MAEGGLSVEDTAASGDLLLCQICKKQLTEPHMLTTCLHSFCHHCLTDLPKNKQAGGDGWLCPQCQCFTAASQLQRSQLLDALLQLEHGLPSQTPVCGQCEEELDDHWKCVDCKMLLCDRCKTLHLKVPLLKAHKMEQINRGSVSHATDHIDEVIFCQNHPDKILERNCKTCKTQICLVCAIEEHKPHHTETIQDAVDNILPDLTKDMAKLDKKIRILKAQISGVKKAKDEAKEKFAAKRMELEDNFEVIINRLKACKASLEENINGQETVALDTLDDVKTSLNNSLNKCSNLCQLSTVCVNKLKNTSLLKALEESVLSAVRAESSEQQTEIEAVVADVQMTLSEDWLLKLTHDYQELLSLTENQLRVATDGSVSLSENDRSADGVGTAKATHRFWDVNFEEFFQQKFKKVHDIKLPSWCPRLALIDDYIWAPLIHENKIEVYNKSGFLAKSINVHAPTSVSQAHNGDVIVSCRQNSGLHLVTADDTTQKICNGSFSDVCTYKDKIYALEYEKKAVHEMSLEQPTGGASGKWKTDRIIALPNVKANAGCFDTLIVKSGNEQNQGTFQMYVMMYNSKFLHLYNDQGQCLNTFTNNMSSSRLCGVDNRGNLLISDFHNKLYRLFSTVEQKWLSDVKTDLHKDQAVCDVICDSDGSVWQVGNGCRLIHYTPQ